MRGKGLQHPNWHNSKTDIGDNFGNSSQTMINTELKTSSDVRNLSAKSSKSTSILEKSSEQEIEGADPVMKTIRNPRVISKWEGADEWCSNAGQSKPENKTCAGFDGSQEKSPLPPLHKLRQGFPECDFEPIKNETIESYSANSRLRTQFKKDPSKIVRKNDGGQLGENPKEKLIYLRGEDDEEVEIIDMYEESSENKEDELEEQGLKVRKGGEANATSEPEEYDDDDEEDEPWRQELHRLPSHESITGGEPISITKMPFLALLKMDIGSGTSYCTSSILTEKWVLTAAHCVARIRRPSDVEVIAGQSGFSSPQFGDKAQKKKGVQVHIHPSFKHSESPGNGDIALIKVSVPFIFDKIHVSKIKLRGRPWFKDVRNENCTSAGWGRQKFYAANTGPLQSFKSVALHGESACPCVPSDQKQTIVCLERSQGKGICKGDSGGPLICNGELVGVAHVLYPTPFLCWQIFSGEPECGDSNWIDIYMYTCPYLDWIRNYVGDKIPPKPKSCSAIRPTTQTLFIAVSVVALSRIMHLYFTRL
ncbi:uncharacterized protein [Bemisia tabaci]|uniref:uncharacterized protein n=1 Tax=Bemisia tabaci TaxID=7038 RepID=UPI003B280808